MAHNLSKVGGWISIVCAIHCMITPVLLGLIPMIHTRSPLVELVENVLIVVSILIAITAVAGGYRDHRRMSIVAMLAASLLLLAAGRLIATERFEAPLVITGAGLMAASQFLNLRFSRSCCRHHANTSRSELSSIASRV